MNKYEITYKIYPAGIFGLPQEGFTVISGAQEIHGDTMSTCSGKIVGLGTLSRYREESEKIIFKANYNDTEVKFNDNFITIVFDEVDKSIAIKKADNTIINFLRILEVFYPGKYFYAEPVEFLENDEAQHFPGSLPYSFRLQWYNLSELKDNLSKIFSKLSILDEVSKRCLEYIDRASLLESIDTELKSFDVRTGAFLKSEIFLNYYKAITVVLGDRTINKDKDYQSRYQKFNISKDYYQSEIEPLWKIRSNYDVAHYQPKEDLEKLQKLIDNIDKARKSALEVFKKYVEYLESKK
jgi:hypothetical protein